MSDERISRSSAHRQALALLRRPLRKTVEERALATVAALRLLQTVTSESTLFCQDEWGDGWQVGDLRDFLHSGYRERGSFPCLEAALVIGLRKAADDLQDIIDDPEDDLFFRATFKAQIRVARALAARLEILLPKTRRTVGEAKR